MGGAEGTVWVVSWDEVGDVVQGRVVDDFVCCQCFEFYVLGDQRPVDGLAERGGGR